MVIWRGGLVQNFRLRVFWHTTTFGNGSNFPPDVVDGIIRRMIPGTMANGFWDLANFKVADAINAERWTRSPQLQFEIQPPVELTAPGSVGPQQAMLEPDPALGIDHNSVLPWVPDLVGNDAGGEHAILLFGAAYAGFIREYSRRGACLALADYVSTAKHCGSDGWAEFQRLFLENVVRPDAAYYGRLASLLASVGVAASRIVLADLCPNSIVKRTVKNNRRSDDSQQPSGKDRASTFCKYVTHPTVAGWTWRRIIESRASSVIALGHIAEHGLLRLFRENGAAISCGGHNWNQSGHVKNSTVWVRRYAHPAKNLGYWLTPGRWWTVSTPGTTVRVLPVYHPSTADNYDPSYSRTKNAVAHFLSNGS